MILTVKAVPATIIGMENNVTTAARRIAGAVCLSLALSAAGVFGGAMAHANGSHDPSGEVAGTTPPQMKLSVSSDQQIRTSGTQGTVASGDQCTNTSSVKVQCVTPSVESAPQHDHK